LRKSSHRVEAGDRGECPLENYRPLSIGMSACRMEAARNESAGDGLNPVSVAELRRVLG
jgi:hypothetical protein